MESEEIVTSRVFASGENSSYPLPLQQVPQNSKGVSTYYPGVFQISAFALHPRVSENAGKPFKRKISVCYSILGLLGVDPFGLLRQNFWDLVSSV